MRRGLCCIPQFRQKRGPAALANGSACLGWGEVKNETPAMSKTNEAVFLKVRMTPEEMAQIDAAKSAGMTRSAWAKRRLLSTETATAGASLSAEIEREFIATRDLIREKNKNLAEAVRRHLVAELVNQSHEIKLSLDVVAAAVKNAGDRAR